MQFPFQLSHDKDFDCVGFGENANDHLLVVSAFPRADTKTALVETVHTSGGQVASAMVGLARLGLRVAYAGRFGADAAGAFGLASLQNEGINTTRAEIIEDAQTHTSYILIDATTGERTVLFKRDERLAYQKKDAPLEVAHKGRVLHIDGQNPAASLRLVEAARESGAIISADFDFVNDDVLALLPRVDMLITAANFPRQATGDDDDERALVHLHEHYGCPMVGLTRGIHGALCYANGIFCETQAFDVPGGVRDATGAGDAFRAGLIHGLLEGESIETAMHMGCAVAALNCRALGGRAGLPSRVELIEFLRQVGG